MGANPVQIEIGEFDEAIEIVEEEEEIVTESKFTSAQIYINSQEIYHNHKFSHTNSNENLKSNFYKSFRLRGGCVSRFKYHVMFVVLHIDRTSYTMRQHLI